MLLFDRLHIMETPSNNSIKQWAEDDRPREKLLIKGKAALSEAELIAILLGSGNKFQSAVDLAKEIYKSCDFDLNQMAKLSITDLMKFNGIGEAKSISIVSALELGRRRKETVSIKKPRITSSLEVYDLIKEELMDQPHEEFWVLLLKRNNEVIKKVQLSKGGQSGTVVDAKILFRKALEYHANSIILIHNHPSGNLSPSKADLQLTKKIKDAGMLMDIPILDHVIFSNEGYYSFADESIL